MKWIFEIYNISLITILGVICLACDRELKEHPIPASLKRRLEMQNDPEIQRKKISGTISIATSAKSRQPDPAVLFIFARPKGQESGPPLAVKRLASVSFPLPYSIGQIDSMLDGADFSGEIQITARLDADGIAGSSFGDLEGKALGMVGSKNIDIVLDFSKTKKRGGIGKVSGTLNIARALKSNLTAFPYLFIYLRPAFAPTNSPPMAVKRLKKFSFPHKFSISEQDSMIPNTKIEGKVILIARLDADGDAKASPGDIRGEVLVKVGENNVLLILDKVLGSIDIEHGNKNSSITGTISVASNIAKEMISDTRMFIIIREKGAKGTLPMAVQLHQNVEFPFNYKIGQQDAMIPGTLVNGEVEVIVRIDRDGNAKSSPGDLEGATFATVGDDRVSIVLNKKI